jgi:hypothetical protein
MFQMPQAGLEVQLAENIDSYPSILITLTLSMSYTACLNYLIFPVLKYYAYFALKHLRRVMEKN